MKKICSIILIVVLIASFTVLCAARGIELKEAREISEKDYDVITYTVRPGDTLWEIASEYKHESDEIRAWISAVNDLNDKQNYLQAWETIYIYAKKG